MTFLGYLVISYIVMASILTLYLVTYEKDNYTEADFDELQHKSFCNMLENEKIEENINRLK